MLKNVPLTSGSRACSFSHDGNRLVIGQDNGEIVILDMVSFKVLAKKRDRGAVIYDVK